MNKITGLLAICLLSPVVVLAGTSPRIPLAQAENICVERALTLADSIRGPYGEHPENNTVKDFYRSCVHAKSGAYPSQKLVLNQNKLFNLNRVLGQ